MTHNVEHASDVSASAIRSFSKALFGGGRYRVEIGAAIHAGDIINTSELADQLNLPKQTVNQELRLLERVGLLHRMDAGTSERKVYLTKQASAYWGFCAEAMSVAEERLRSAAPFQ